jgi:chromosome partitioning protein
MKKTHIIAVLCHKGGVAKTTTTAALAGALVKSHPSKKVLILDCDEQSNIKTIFGVKLNEAEGGVASMLLQNTAPGKVKVSVRPQIDVILSGGRAMRDFEKTHANTPDSELILKRRMDSFDRSYDFILIDSPPALSLISSNIAMYADYCLLPCTPDLLSIVGVRGTLFFLENLETYFREKGLSPSKVLGVVPTMYDQRRILDMTILDDLQRMANADLTRGGTVFDPIRNDIKIKTAQVRRKLITEAFPTSKAAMDYEKLAADVLARISELEQRTTHLRKHKENLPMKPAKKEPPSKPASFGEV